MLSFDFKCPNCNKSLRSKGIYHRVRLVLDMKDFYYLAAEYLDCNLCNGTFISYDNKIFDQLPYSVRAKFPAVLTYKYACDQAVVSLTVKDTR